MWYSGGDSETPRWSDICGHLLLKLNTRQYLIYIFNERWPILVTTTFNFTWILIDKTFARVNRKPHNNKTRDIHRRSISRLSPYLISPASVACNFTRMLKLFLKQASPIWVRVSFAVMLLSIALASWLIRNRGSENLVKEPVIEENRDRPSRLPRIDPIQVKILKNFEWSYIVFPILTRRMLVLMLLSFNNVHKAWKTSPLLAWILICLQLLIFLVKHRSYKKDLFRAKYSTISNPHCKELDLTAVK